ncbi:Helix-turn-helix domain-containing protein [Sulfitobacter marinus]|uniref:Helix-turn-helix domain-containing protein n=1 Tax=Sulfitobacter marinus TaxID=394264 RepID=A0A1I6RTD5_9RHOB|nr:Helix-turn-helix domain-containing protein [Sulfitobacter marinus]
MQLTPVQCRMARAGVSLSRAKLADLAGVSAATLADFEGGKRESYDRTVRDIQSVLEGLGVTFLVSNEDGPGVRVNEG